MTICRPSTTAYVACSYLVLLVWEYQYLLLTLLVSATGPKVREVDIYRNELTPNYGMKLPEVDQAKYLLLLGGWGALSEFSA